jgi:hypothetical protein
VREYNLFVLMLVSLAVVVVIFLHGLPLTQSMGLCNMSYATYSFSSTGYLYFRSPQASYTSYSAAQNFCKQTHPDAIPAIMRDYNSTRALYYLIDWNAFVGLVQNSTLVEPGGNWYWVDGKPYGYWYGSWDNGQPNNANSGQNCACTDSNYMVLNDVECSQATAQYYYYALCEVHRMSNFSVLLLILLSNIGSNCSSQVCHSGSVSEGTSCSLCTPGKYWLSKSCVNCDPGRSTSYFGSPSCYRCTSGKYASLDGQSACNDCPEGTYMPDTGAQTCTDCPTGYWVTGQGSNSRSKCSVCASGYEQAMISFDVGNQTLSSSNSTCIPCQPGLFSSQANSSCSACDVGKYAGQPGSTSCDMCAAGRFTQLQQQASCELCPSGRFSDVTGSTSSDFCMECPSGKYAEASGNSFCMSCDSGKWSKGTGQVRADTCKSCPITPGVECPVGSTYPFVGAGLFRLLDSPEVVYTCVPGEACAAAGLGNTSCSVNYDGFRCSFCADGSFRYGGKCLKCLPVSARWCILVVASLGFLLALKKISSAQNLIPPQVKMTFMWLQMLALFPSLSTAWPTALQVIFNFGSFLNFDIGYLGLGCDIKRAPYFPVLLVKITLPFIFLIFSIGVELIATRGKIVDLAKTISHFLFITNFFSIQLFSAMFQSFNCVKQNDGALVLFNEPSISCRSSDWSTFVGVDSCFIFFYVVIIPGLCIWKWRFAENAPSESTRRLLGPLTQTYRKGAEWFELNRIIFRLAFVIIRDVLQVSSTMKISLLIFLLMYQAFVESRSQPYAEKAHNDLSLM